MKKILMFFLIYSLLLLSSCNSSDKGIISANIRIGETVILGKYEQNNNITDGSESIEWIVLDIVDGKALLISKYILDAEPTHG